MKLTASTPVTIHAARHAMRWFTTAFRHIDGTLFLYIEYTYDAYFGPVMCLRSTDNGRTWTEQEENVPRLIWAHSFADGEYFEIDMDGFLHPREKDTYWYWGAWSFPGDPTRPVRKEFVKVLSPSTGTQTFLEMRTNFLTQPTHPWWRILNTFELGAEKALAEEERLGHPPVPKAFEDESKILIGGIHFTAGFEHDGRLIGIGYGNDRFSTPPNRTSVFCLESRDRGRTWKEVSVVARASTATPEGFNETGAVRLKDGRFYCVLRTGTVFYHTWSRDGGKTWTPPEPMRLIDSDHQPRKAWPVCKVLDDGTLVLAYGRPGKHIIFDPSGTGTQWQGRVDLQALELATQARNGVPPNLRLRGDTDKGIRQWDSGDYLFLAPVGPREMLVGYDVQYYVERAGATPFFGVRMVRVRLED